MCPFEFFAPSCQIQKMSCGTKSWVFSPSSFTSLCFAVMNHIWNIRCAYHAKNSSIQDNCRWMVVETDSLYIHSPLYFFSLHFFLYFFSSLPLCLPLHCFYKIYRDSTFFTYYFTKYICDEVSCYLIFIYTSATLSLLCVCRSLDELIVFLLFNLIQGEGVNRMEYFVLGKCPI